MKLGRFCPIELRTICEKGLLLITITIPEMEVCDIFFPVFTGYCCGFLYVVLEIELHLYGSLVLDIYALSIFWFSAAHSLAFYVDYDYSTDLYWCCCYGKFSSKVLLPYYALTCYKCLKFIIYSNLMHVACLHFAASI